VEECTLVNPDMQASRGPHVRKPAENVDAYICASPKDAQPNLRAVREAIRQVAPDATEGISYGIPYYSYKGRLAWFGLQKAHIGLYIRPPVIEEHERELSGYETTMSAVHLPRKGKIPVLLIKKLVRARIKKNEGEERDSRSH